MDGDDETPFKSKVGNRIDLPSKLRKFSVLCVNVYCVCEYIGNARNEIKKKMLSSSTVHLSIANVSNWMKKMKNLCKMSNM